MSRNYTGGWISWNNADYNQMQMGMESCLGKTVMAGVMGGGLGAMFGLFMASVRFSTTIPQYDLS
jgi:import inner membrane translocase subunit TIM22